MKYLKLILVLFVAVSFISGCAGKLGTKIEASNVSKIVKGKTTKKEILDTFGKPYSWSTRQSYRGPNGEEVKGGETWHYQYAEGKNYFATVSDAFSGELYKDNTSQSLTVNFVGDVVSDYLLAGGNTDEHFNSIKGQQAPPQETPVQPKAAVVVAEPTVEVLPVVPAKKAKATKPQIKNATPVAK